MNIPFEKVETINRRLHDHYGETEERGNRLPNYRIVWSEDQTELRKTDYTDAGVRLLHPEVRQLPKYRQWIQEKWVLERLTVVPFINEQDLPDSKLSYEPIWVFEDRNGQKLHPAWRMAQFVVDGIHKKMAEAGAYARYKDKNETPEQVEHRLKEIEAHLYQNESNVGDALATKNAISMAGLDPKNPDLKERKRI
jgi:hypothetical protein